MPKDKVDWISVQDNTRPEYINPGEVAITGRMTACRMYKSNSAPTANDDGIDSLGSGQVYYQSDLWHDVTNNKFFFCNDNTACSAVWTPHGGEIIVYDDAVAETTALVSMNFTGQVTVTEGAAGALTINIPGGSGISGGATGQILVKQSNANYDYDWQAQSSGTDLPEVTAFANLPAASDSSGKEYVVLESTGFLWNRRRGLYRSDGTDWNRLSRETAQVRSDEFSIRDASDTSKRLAFSVSEVTTATTRTLTMPNSNVDLGDIADNTTHRSSDGSDHSLVNSAVQEADYDANTILAATADDTPVALTVAEDTIVGRVTTGAIDALTPTEVRTMINVEDGADVTDSTNVDAAGAVMEADYDANTILAATADDTPAAVTIGEDRIVGRITAGAIAALTATQVRTMINVEDGADVTDSTNVDAAGAVMEADYNANTILAATADDTPAALTVGEDRIVGRVTAGAIASLTAAQVRTMINVEDGADVTDSTNVDAAGAVMESDFNANTVLAATVDDTPAALTVGEDRIVGRVTGGAIAALTATQVRTFINVEDGATADQTDAEIETAYNNQVSRPTEAQAEAVTSATVYRWAPLDIAYVVKQILRDLSATAAPGSPETNDLWIDIS